MIHVQMQKVLHMQCISQSTGCVCFQCFDCVLYGRYIAVYDSDKELGVAAVTYRSNNFYTW